MIGYIDVDVKLYEFPSTPSGAELLNTKLNGTHKLSGAGIVGAIGIDVGLDDGLKGEVGIDVGISNGFDDGFKVGDT